MIRVYRLREDTMAMQEARADLAVLRATAPNPFGDLQLARELRAAAPCPTCAHGRRDEAAIATHNLRVSEFGERSYRWRTAPTVEAEA